jgi:hypothetical protein
MPSVLGRQKVKENPFLLQCSFPLIRLSRTGGKESADSLTLPKDQG